jgi:hypothetical protein
MGIGKGRQPLLTNLQSITTIGSQPSQTQRSIDYVKHEDLPPTHGTIDVGTAQEVSIKYFHTIRILHPLVSRPNLLYTPP